MSYEDIGFAHAVGKRLERDRKRTQGWIDYANDLERQYASLCEEYDKIANEKNELAQKLAEAENDVKKSQDYISQLTSERDALKHTCEEQSRDTQDHFRKMHILADEVAALKTEAFDKELPLKQKISELTEQVRRYKASENGVTALLRYLAVYFENPQYGIWQEQYKVADFANKDAYQVWRESLVYYMSSVYKTMQIDGITHGDGVMWFTPLMGEFDDKEIDPWTRE